MLVPLGFEYFSSKNSNFVPVLSMAVTVNSPVLSSGALNYNKVGLILDFGLYVFADEKRFEINLLFYVLYKNALNHIN